MTVPIPGLVRSGDGGGRRVAAPVDRAWLVPAAVIAGTAYLVGFAWSMENSSYDIWAAFLLGPLLVALTVPLARRAARAENDPRVATVLLVAVILKLAGAIVLYAVSSEVYDGVADAFTYHDEGTVLSESFRDGDFSVELPYGFGLVGTGFVFVLTGSIYAVIGSTQLGGFLVFAWMGFLGLYLLYRAFCIGFPNGRRRRYAALLFFLPSMLFWSSTIGKEAWMTLTLGLAAYGMARVLDRRHGMLVAVAALAAGLVGSAMVRPHVTLLAFAGTFVAFLLRRTRGANFFSPAKLAGVAVLVVAGVLLVGQVERFLGIDRLDRESVEEVLAQTASNTESFEGSTVEATLPSPATFPKAIVTVLFRPFPHEARNLQQLLASFEGVALLVLFVLAARTMPAVLRLGVRWPYLVFSAVFAVLFILSFSSFGNFGLLARERVQVLPFALVLAALPVPPRPPRGRGRPAPGLRAATRPVVASGPGPSLR